MSYPVDFYCVAFTDVSDDNLTFVDEVFQICQIDDDEVIHYL